MADQEMKVRVLTKAPVILTAAHASQVMTETKQTISGTMLRGLMAKRYIRENQLGKDAHRDDSFRKLFFNTLRFTPAMPVKNGKKAFILPLSLQKSKEVGENGVPEIQDLLKIGDAEQPKIGFKSLKGLAVRTENGLQTVSIPTRISLHMTRSDASRRILGSSQDGGIFNYEAIDAGQIFEGSIFGPAEDLQKLRQGLSLDDEQGFDGQIGRSRFTEYGSCHITVEAPSALNLPDANDEDGSVVFLRFATPYLPQINGTGNDSFEYASDAKDLLQPLLNHMGEGFSIDKFFSAAVETGGFVGIWGLPQPESKGLAAGTIFAIKKDTAWTSEDFDKLGKILYKGIGDRTSEGYGQLRVWPQQKDILAPKKEYVSYKNRHLPKGFHASDTVRKQVVHILTKRIAESLKEQAYEDVFGQGKERGLAVRPNDKNFFSRLASFLEAAKAENGSLRQNMERKIQQERTPKDNLIRAKQSKSITPFAARLSAISVGGTFLGDYFMAGQEMPYTNMVQTKLNDARVKELIQAVSASTQDFDFQDGGSYYEYWRWFCRYARKKCSDKQDYAGGIF